MSSFGRWRQTLSFAYIDGNIDKILLEQDVVRPLKNCERLEKPYLQSLQNTVAYADEIEIVDIKDSPQNVASCDVAFFIEGEDNAYIFSLRKPAARAIGEPPTSSVMKGPREGFIEEIKTNMSLVRKRIKSPDLVVKTFEVGRYSSTTVALMYIRGVADEKSSNDYRTKSNVSTLTESWTAHTCFPLFKPKNFILHSGGHNRETRRCIRKTARRTHRPDR